MAVNTIDAKMLAKMFLAGAKNLESKKEWINELNVFPVPDGDTGTNMTLTIMSAAKDVAAMNANNDLDMKSLANAISSASLILRIPFTFFKYFTNVDCRSKSLQ